MKTVHNFYPGPGVLPRSALETAQREMLDFEGSGISLLEMSHRSPEYGPVHEEAQALLRELMDIPAGYKTLLMQGGASLQFAMIPMNLLGEGKSADYVVTGHWSLRAIAEARIAGSVRVAGEGEKKDGRYVTIPKKLDLDPKAEYVHITTNNTIMGTQFFNFPDTGGVPLVGDMSSDILWRPMDVRPFGIVYAGAHKNLGPSGLTVVILRDDVLAKCKKGLPTLLTYQTHVDNDSMFNTPVTFTIYMVRNVLRWIKEQGGAPEMERRARARAKLFYDFVDASGGFYTNPIPVEDRSVMNAVFYLPTKELEAKLVAEAKAAGILGLRNFHPEGGGRLTMYNALPIESVKAAVEFLGEFMRKNG